MSAFHRKHSSARSGSAISTLPEEIEVRQADARFQHALALAFLRGDHHPADEKGSENSNCPQPRPSIPTNGLSVASLVVAGV